MLPNNVQVFSAIPANADANSTALWAEKIVRCSVQAVSTASNTGTIQLQGSNDQAIGKPPGQYQPTNWSDIGSAVTLAGTTPVLITEIECSYEYLRVVYADASGGTATGTVSARLKSMGL